MKKFSVFAALVFLISCTSGTKSNEVNRRKAEPSSRESGLVEMSAPKPVTADPLPPVNVKSEAIATNPDRLLLQFQEAIQKQDDRNIAISSREILIRDPKNISALNALALYYFKKGQLDLSKSLLNKAISIDNQVSLLYSNLGFIHQSLGEETEAIQMYRLAMKEDASNPIAAANAGFLYLKRKDYRKAQVAFEIAVEKGQKDWKTFSNYGVTLMALGQYPLAQVQFKKALELQSQNVEVQLNYAILLIEHMNKLNEGLDVVNRIRFLGPGPDMRKKISELENRAKSVLK